eukprot:1713370-Pyramimonas_sp.AAC.2
MSDEGKGVDRGGAIPIGPFRRALATPPPELSAPGCFLAYSTQRHSLTRVSFSKLEHLNGSHGSLSQSSDGSTVKLSAPGGAFTERTPHSQSEEQLFSSESYINEPRTTATKT